MTRLAAQATGAQLLPLKGTVIATRQAVAVAIYSAATRPLSVAVIARLQAPMSGQFAQLHFGAQVVAKMPLVIDLARCFVTRCACKASMNPALARVYGMCADAALAGICGTVERARGRCTVHVTVTAIAAAGDIDDAIDVQTSAGHDVTVVKGRARVTGGAGA